MFNHFVHILVLIQYLLSTTNGAPHCSIHDQLDGSCMQALLRRARRAQFTFFGDQSHPEYKTGDNSPVIIGDSSLYSSSTSETVLKTLRKQTNRVLEGAGDIITAPASLLSNLISYWWVDPSHLLLILMIAVGLSISSLSWSSSPWSFVSAVPVQLDALASLPIEEAIGQWLWPPSFVNNRLQRWRKPFERCLLLLTLIIIHYFFMLLTTVAFHLLLDF